jgi:hypothetical protein
MKNACHNSGLTSLNALHIRGKSLYDMPEVGFKSSVWKHVLSGNSETDIFIL